MPYTTPTADQFFERFPIFEDKDEDVVSAILAEAASQLDDSWRDADYQPAVMYLAAHMLATDNTDAGTEVEVGGLSTISSESFSGMSVSYSTAGPQTGAAASKYGSTEYGRRYYNLLIKNKPGIAVA